VSFSAIYTSPLSRARETAERIASPHGIIPAADDGLIDINYGEWEGVPKEEVIKMYGKLYEAWEEKPEDVIFPGGEGLSHVRERAFGTMVRFAEKHEGGAVALVSHRVPNKVMLLSVLGMGNDRFWDIEQDTACVNLVRYRGVRFIVSRINDTSAFKPLSSEGESDF
jgi:broad specificity phosphatase PhoE